MPIPVGERSKMWVCDRSLAGIAGSNPAGVMNVCCGCCKLLGTGKVGPMTRPGHLYQLRCI